MAETVGSRLRTALAVNGWNQSDLVRETGIDKNTISAIANDRSMARASTLAKIEEALGLTPGTLAGGGEDVPTAPPAPSHPSDLSDAELVAELSYRLEHANRMAERFRDEAAAAADDAALGMRLRITRDHWIDLAERSDDEWLQHLASEVNHLRERCAEGHGEPGEEAILAESEDKALLLALADDLGYELHKGQPEDQKINRQDDVLQNLSPDDVALAARRNNSKGKREAKIHDRLGQESQDHGGWEPA